MYLRLSTRTIEQPQRPMSAGPASRDHRGRLLAAPAGAELRHRDRLYRRGGAGGDRGGRLHRRKPSRRRPACDHLGRPAAWRMDRRTENAPGSPRGSVSEPHRKSAGAAVARLRHRHRASTAIRRRSAGSAASAATASRRSASSSSARPARSATSTATTASTPTPSSMRRKASPSARRCGTGRWRCDVDCRPGAGAHRYAAQNRGTDLVCDFREH